MRWNTGVLKFIRKHIFDYPFITYLYINLFVFILKAQTLLCYMDAAMFAIVVWTYRFHVWLCTTSGFWVRHANGAELVIPGSTIIN